MSDDNRTTYNTILGTHEDGSVVILETTFEHSPTFKGATGVIVRPVTEDDIREAMREKVEYLRELADDLDAHGMQRRQIVNMPKDEYLEHRFETYNDISREAIAEALGTEVPERYTLESCGRVFPRALEGIQLIDSKEVREALAAIRNHEAN